MSNPAVIYLSEFWTSKGECFRVEDNIGESIHLHYANLRFDITIEELFSLSNLMKDVVEQLIEVDSFNIDNFDPVFLKNVGGDLLDIKKVELHNIKLEELKVQRKNTLKLPVISSLRHSMMLRALNGDKEEYINYEQENPIFVSNKERLESINEYMSNVEYPFNNEYIVLFNEQNIIRDGQHRASVLMNNGVEEVKVLRVTFKDDKVNVSSTPYIDYLFRWDIPRIKNVLRYFWRLYNKFKTRLNKKIKRTF